MYKFAKRAVLMIMVFAQLFSISGCAKKAKYEVKENFVTASVIALDAMERCMNYEITGEEAYKIILGAFEQHVYEKPVGTDLDDRTSEIFEANSPTVFAFFDAMTAVGHVRYDRWEPEDLKEAYTALYKLVYNKNP